MEHRRSAADALAGAFAARAAELGLDGEVELAYRPRSRATTADELAAELSERLDGDLDRGFTGLGPHRDDLALTRDGRDLRVYGSQGQQRLALLALLLAERAALTLVRGAPPIMLLDDVLSELDPARRARLIDLLREGGQSVITTADATLVPGSEESGAVRIRVAEGGVLSEEPVPGEQAVAGGGAVSEGVAAG